MTPLEILTALVTAQIEAGKGLAPEAVRLAGELAKVLGEGPPVKVVRPAPAAATPRKPPAGRFARWAAASGLTPEARRCFGPRSKLAETLGDMTPEGFEATIARARVAASAGAAELRERFHRETEAAARAWLALSPAERDARRAGEGRAWPKTDARHKELEARDPCNPTPEAGVGGAALRSARAA